VRCDMALMQYDTGTKSCGLDWWWTRRDLDAVDILGLTPENPRFRLRARSGDAGKLDKRSKTPPGCHEVGCLSLFCKSSNSTLYPAPNCPRNPKLGPPMRDPDSTIVDRAHHPRAAIR
jgi:hypothetical protein